MTNVRKGRCKERSEDALEMERLKSVSSKLKHFREAVLSGVTLAMSGDSFDGHNLEGGANMMKQGYV